MHFETLRHPRPHTSEEIENLQGGNENPLPSNEKILPNFDLLLPKFHFILPNFYFPVPWRIFVFQQAIRKFLRRKGIRGEKVASASDTISRLSCERVPPETLGKGWRGTAQHQICR